MPLKLPQLERLLLRVAYILRGRMDATKFEQYVFDMLFLVASLSGIFHERFEQIMRDQMACGEFEAGSWAFANMTYWNLERFYFSEEARRNFLLKVERGAPRRPCLPQRDALWPREA